MRSGQRQQQNRESAKEYVSTRRASTGTAGENSGPNRIGTIHGDAATRLAPTSAVTNVVIRAARPTRAALGSRDSTANIT